MTELLNDPVVWVAADLLDRYGFERGAFSAEQLIGYWLRSYPAEWIRSAVLEALYQGRYKSVSVGQILAIWKRRGQPLYHYSFEFERMICGTLARIPTMEAPPAEQTAPPAAIEDAPPAIAMDAPQDNPAPQAETTAASRLEEMPSSEPAMELSTETIAPFEESSDGAPMDLVPRRSERLAPDGDDTWLEATIIKPAEEMGDRPIPLAPSPASNDDFAFLSASSNWTQPDLIRPPIHQFIPDNEGSLFYEKLRAVAHEQLN
ncbi:hypothetical protein [Vacuolonema iberomarrocanum]|uniref:hypothetical protein n=1 Tax=Vacuolonema iberomarrocanum TaxID=3454632 RepID=UPI0019F2B82D|nr:hypothetical protein [filamentous cyanobacterium LEGE 07170]